MSHADPSQPINRIIVVSGDSSDRLIAPDLSPVGSQPIAPPAASEPPLRLAYFNRPRRRFDWRVFAAVIAAGAFATAGGVTAARFVPRTESTGLEMFPTVPVEIPLVTSYADAARALSGGRLPGVSTIGRATTTLLSRSATPRARSVPTVARIPTTPSAMTSQSTPVSPGNCVQTCAGNVECLLHCPYQGHEAGHGLTLPSPTAQQVELALQSVRGAVMVCGMGVPNAPTSVRATITFGSSGSPQSIDLSGPFEGTGPGSCIQRAIRRAHVPAFSDPTFRTSYTFAVQ